MKRKKTYTYEDLAVFVFISEKIKRKNIFRFDEPVSIDEFLWYILGTYLLHSLTKY